MAQHFLPGNSYKNFSLNEKFYQQMTTIRAFFLQIRALFPICEKGQGRLPPLVTRLLTSSNINLRNLTSIKSRKDKDR